MARTIADVAQLKRHQRRDEIFSYPGCLRVIFSNSKLRKIHVTLGISSPRYARVMKIMIKLEIGHAPYADAC